MAVVAVAADLCHVLVLILFNLIFNNNLEEDATTIRIAAEQDQPRLADQRVLRRGGQLTHRRELGQRRRQRRRLLRHSKYAYATLIGDQYLYITSAVNYSYSYFAIDSDNERRPRVHKSHKRTSRSSILKKSTTTHLNSVPVQSLPHPDVIDYCTFLYAPLCYIIAGAKCRVNLHAERNGIVQRHNGDGGGGRCCCCCGHDCKSA